MFACLCLLRSLLKSRTMFNYIKLNNASKISAHKPGLSVGFSFRFLSFKHLENLSRGKAFKSVPVHEMTWKR